MRKSHWINPLGCVNEIEKIVKIATTSWNEVHRIEQLNMFENTSLF